jgi:hypothetical protein
MNGGSRLSAQRLFCFGNMIGKADALSTVVVAALHR